MGPCLLVGYAAFRIEFEPIVYLSLTIILFECLVILIHFLFIAKFKER